MSKKITVKDLLADLRIKGLKPSSFKAYCVLLEKAGDEKLISKFSIRGQAKEWMMDKNLNLVSSKDTVKTILDELEKVKLIKLDLEKKELKILF
jgi:hypothetical protein